MSLFSDTEYLLHVLRVLVTYLPTTLRISALSLLWAMIIGLLVAVIQLKRVPVLDPLTRIYVLLTRACPLMIQLYLVYFGIPLLLLYLRQTGRMPIVIREGKNGCGSIIDRQYKLCYKGMDRGGLSAGSCPDCRI